MPTFTSRIVGDANSSDAAQAIIQRKSAVRVAVIGAGAYGGWTALYLLRRGARITLLDGWDPGNSRSSSGGETRIIRGTYGPNGICTKMIEGLQAARDYLSFRFPLLKDAPLIESRVCQYEQGPDENFIIDRHPQAANVWLVGGGSGHGFKYGPAIGEMLSDLVFSGKSPDNFSPWPDF